MNDKLTYAAIASTLFALSVPACDDKPEANKADKAAPAAGSLLQLKSTLDPTKTNIDKSETVEVQPIDKSGAQEADLDPALDPALNGHDDASCGAACGGEPGDPEIDGVGEWVCGASCGGAPGKAELDTTVKTAPEIEPAPTLPPPPTK